MNDICLKNNSFKKNKSNILIKLMSKDILYYLCCGCFGERSTNKRQTSSQKIKKLRTLNEITPKSPKSSAFSSAKDPLTVSIEDMTDLYNIPKDFKTEYELLQRIGYKKLGFIDSGSYGNVYEGVHIERGVKVAIKEIKVPEPINKITRFERLKLLEDVKNELYSLQKVKHPHVIHMIQHFMVIFSGNQMTLYIVMQLAKKSTLSKICDIKSPINENLCKLWFAQLLSGLSYMHSQGIAHRDLKHSNILLDDSNDCLISDFGLSRLVWRESQDKVLMSKTYCGTPPYIAPEVLALDPHCFVGQQELPYNAFLADVWALGVILFKLYDNNYPFNKKAKKAIKRMKFRKYYFIRTPTPGLKDIIHDIFEPDPQKRPKMSELQNHYWIKDVFQTVQQKVNQISEKYATN